MNSVSYRPSSRAALIVRFCVATCALSTAAVCVAQSHWSSPTATGDFRPASLVNVFGSSDEKNFYADFTLKQSNPGDHRDHGNAAFAISSRPKGSGENGPAHADYGFIVSVIKDGWITQPARGEIDGINVVTRQGHDDTSGILVNSGNVAGFSSLLEGVDSQFEANTGVIVAQIDVQLGEIQTGATGPAGMAGLVSTKTVGKGGSGLLIQSVRGADWGHAITVNGSEGGGNTFVVTPAGDITAAGSLAVESISGVTNGKPAMTGAVGEVIAVRVKRTEAKSLVSARPATVLSVALSAGDWDCTAIADFLQTPATSLSAIHAGLSTTANSFSQSDDENDDAMLNANFAKGLALTNTLTINLRRFNVAAPTRVYLVAEAQFSASESAYGHALCRRAR